jgi:K+-transporting ATPase KdpF subunit
MPGWLTLVCSAAVIVACGYLLYVILRPERF